MREAVIGVDVGTGSARAAAFDRAGRLLGRGQREIAIWRGAGGVVEHSTDDLWRAVVGAVRMAVEASGLPPAAVRGLGFAATCSLVALDAALDPLPVSPSGERRRDVIAWMDHRAAHDAERMTRSGHDVLRFFGGSMSPEMQPPKLAWLARAAPETFASARHFLGLTDWLTFRATGALTRSLCSVACKFGYLAHEGRWPADFFEAMGLGALARDGFVSLGAEIAAPGAALTGGVSAEAAQAFGLVAGTPVGAGLVDAHAGALGTIGGRDESGAADPLRRLALVLGTSSCCLALADAPRFLPGAWGPHLSVLTPGRWLIDAGQSAFGGAIDHVLALHPAFRGGAGDLAALEAEIAARAGGLAEAALLAERVHVLPGFIGDRAPDADAQARGALVGLDLSEDRASLHELYAACLVGLGCGLADIVDSLRAAGYAFDAAVVSGGASKSPLVRRLIADSCDLALAAAGTPEPVLLGSAMLGAAAAGWGGLDALMGVMSTLGERIEPSGGAVAAFHRRKRRAFRAVQAAERRTRAAMRAWPELVIFDCDGVLVDSEVIALDVTRRMLGEAGIALSAEEVRARFLGIGQESGLERLAAERGQRLPDGFAEALTEALLAAFVRELQPIAGVHETVAALAARVCVASSSAPDRLRLSLRVTGLERLFAPHVYSAAQVARGKPSPDLFLFAAHEMGAHPRASLVIEDSVSGVAAARAAGMAVFGFVGGGHCAGVHHGAELTGAGADLIFDDMARLPAILAASDRAGPREGG